MRGTSGGGLNQEGDVPSEELLGCSLTNNRNLVECTVQPDHMMDYIQRPEGTGGKAGTLRLSVVPELWILHASWFLAELHVTAVKSGKTRR